MTNCHTYRLTHKNLTQTNWHTNKLAHWQTDTLTHCHRDERIEKPTNYHANKQTTLPPCSTGLLSIYPISTVSLLLKSAPTTALITPSVRDTGAAACRDYVWFESMCNSLCDRECDLCSFFSEGSQFVYKCKSRESDCQNRLAVLDLHNFHWSISVTWCWKLWPLPLAFSIAV